MKRIRRKTKRRIVLGAAAVAAVLLLILIVNGVRSLIGGHADTSAGLEYIKQEESGDVTAIEAKISQLEAKDNNGEDTRSLKEKFMGSVVVGDSITEGFTEYDVLNASSVVAKIGVHFNELDDMINQVSELSPQIIFLTLGMNDITGTDSEAVDKFISEYQTVISQLQEKVPDAHIFVNSLFPVQESATEDEPALAAIPQYNEAIQTMCEDMSIGYIDNTGLVQEQYYEQDGIHFKAEFYPIWGENMAEVAAL